MTPPSPRVPYKAEAAAPLTTSMLSMSLGLRSERRRAVTKPSTTIKGSISPVTDFDPRRYTDAPALPPNWSIRRPATFPRKLVEASRAGTVPISSWSTLVNAKDSFLRLVPCATPVTTTSSRSLLAGLSSITMGLLSITRESDL
ncbi:hypothetical protein D3C71_1238120 [compost metagenome]